MTTSAQTEIINNLSDLIAQGNTSLQQERHHPGFDADKMDSAIKTLTSKVSKLREIREQLEDLFATPDY